jgi:hypothetical protein
MVRGDAVSSDTISPAHEDTVLSISGNSDVDMYEERPIAGPSTSLANLPEPTRSMTPDSTYLTPVSPPSSPTQLHSSFQIPGMEDDGPIVGPSSMPMAVTYAVSRLPYSAIADYPLPEMLRPLGIGHSLTPQSPIQLQLLYLAGVKQPITPCLLRRRLHLAAHSPMFTMLTLKWMLTTTQVLYYHLVALHGQALL